jgi:tetratricopeptide (TPR) repeat protein
MRGLDPRIPPAVAAVLLLLLIGLLFPGLVARYQHQQGLHRLKAGNLDGAKTSFADVARWLPAYFFANDHLRLALAQGDLSYGLAGKAVSLVDFYALMDTAADSYRRAVALQPRDLNAWTGLVRSVEVLERIYPFLEKRPYPGSALPIFAELFRLMPVNIHAYRFYVSYLHSRQMPREELHAAIARTVFLYPTFYFQLRTQPFYTAEMDSMLSARLEEALHEDIFSAEAMQALSHLALSQGDTATAAAWYRKSIPAQTFRDISHLYLHLGGLELQAGDFEAAAAVFLQALHSGDRENKMRRIHTIYTRHDAHREFLALVDLVVKTYPLTEFIDLLRAQALIALDLPALASARLQRITAPDYLAESYVLQARIAEKLENWDEMELTAQRATVLAPSNSSYHLLFSRALQRQKKWPQAEKAADAAIAHNQGTNPWLYNHRAGLRWQQKKYTGAGADWRRAVELAPTTGHFHYQLALTYEQVGNQAAALRHLDRAIALNPEQTRYSEKRRSLQTNN